MSKTRAELLAPAGSRESLEAALAAGADAVYMGGQRFGARAYAENPDDSGVLSAIDYVHLHGKRLYLTVNTLLKERELERELVPWLKPIYEHGLDAVLVQDLGVMAVIRRKFPDMEIHVSTQMGVGMSWGANLAKELGASRLVLPRELSLEEIRRLHRETDLELEAFVHGALCYCTSGQCLMSSMIGGRSGNRGRCAQPCRLPYNGQNLLNLKDLCTLELLPDILEAGVTSLKIEGRMKGPRYTAGVVSVYRKYLDLLEREGRDRYRVEPEDVELLRMLFDRGGFSQGYYRRHNGADMIFPGERPKQRPMDEAVLGTIDEKYLGKNLQEGAEGALTVRVGEPARLAVTCRGITLQVTGPEVSAAKSRPLQAQEIRERFAKTGGTPFTFETFSLDLGENAFLPVGAMNALRREALLKLKEAVCGSFRRTGQTATETREAREAVPDSEKPRDIPEIWAQTENPALFTVLLEEPGLSGVYLPMDRISSERWKDCVKRFHVGGKKVVFALPHLLRGESAAFLLKTEPLWREAGADGWLIRSLDEVGFLRERRAPGLRIFDGGLYTWNREAVRQMRSLGADILTLPFEERLEEWRERGLGPADEMLVYGRIPLMVSSQCTGKTTGRCRKGELSGEELARFCDFRPLTDRRKAVFPEDSHCRFCYTVIFNSVPLWLPDRVPGEVRRVRYAFTDETPEEAREILRGAAAGRPERPDAFTRGHFARGVE